MCVRASMKAAKPLHIVLATNPNPTRARGYPLNINPKPDPKPDSISGPAGSGRVADLYHVPGNVTIASVFWLMFCRFYNVDVPVICLQCHQQQQLQGQADYDNTERV